MKLKGFSESTELFLRDGNREPRGARPRGGPAAPRRAGRRAALRRGGLGLPARPRRPDLGRGERAARRLRPARLRRRGRRPLRRAVRAARRAAGDPPPAPARGQPAGVGARRPLRRGRPAGRGARRRRRRRPHRLRPGRDRALPARRLARPARAAGDAAARRPADPPAAGRLARRHRGLVRRARPAVARGPQQRHATRSPATAPATASCPPCASCTRPPRRTCSAPSSCCATRPPCSTPRSTPCSPRPATRRRSSTCARCRRRSPAWWSSGSPTRPADRPSVTALTRSWRSPSTVRSTSAEACAPGSKGAAWSFVTTPPRVRS